MPLCSILVPPIPVMMFSMIFSSKVLSSSSSSWARAAPAVITRPPPTATTASRKARLMVSDEVCTIQPLASVLRIAIPVQSFRVSRTPIKAQAARLPGIVPGSYQPGSGRFCGGYHYEGVIQQARYPGNNRHVRKVKYVPIEGFSPDLDVEQGEIDHGAIGEAVVGIADGPANEQAERERGEPAARPGHPDRQHDHCHDLDREQNQLADRALVLE